jgi:tetratricopeptide (TPR) repeat protein
MALRNHWFSRQFGLFATGLLLAGLSGCSSATPEARLPPASATNAEQAQALFQRGREAADRGDSVRAEQYFSLALERGYDSSRVLPLLLRVCLASSRLRATLDHAEPYLRDHPEAEALRYLVATIHAGLGQTADAHLELEQLLRTNPNSADGHYLLGILDSDTDASSARAHFRSYLDVTPGGEHAAEVRGRLAELAVRDEAKARDASRAQPTGSAEQNWLDVRGRRIAETISSAPAEDGQR